MHACKPTSTAISNGVNVGKDEDFEKVDYSMHKILHRNLLYLTARTTKILFVVTLLSWLMHSPRSTHHKTVKSVLSYIKGTSTFETFFPTTAEVNTNLIGYSYSDFGSKDDDSTCIS